MWRLNNILLNNTWTKEENLGDAMKTVLERKFILLNAYIKKEERYKVNGLNFSLIKLE